MKRIKWYQVLRMILPLLYTALLVSGLFYKSMTIMLLFMASALLAGSFFCGWLCPLGFAQELLVKLARLLYLPKISIPPKIEKWLRFTRYIIFGLSFLGLAMALILISPYQSFAGLLNMNFAYITVGSWLTMGAFLTFSLFIDRPFCRYFCSEGAQYGIVSMGRIFSIKRNKEKCVSCGICDKKCPMEIEISTKNHIRNGQCINCFQCLAACPAPEALSYGQVIKKKKMTKIEEARNG